MNHYVGLDVSLKEVSICVVDAEGSVVNRATWRPNLMTLPIFCSRKPQMWNVLCMKVEYLPLG